MNNSISMYFDLETGNFLCVLVKMKRKSWGMRQQTRIKKKNCFQLKDKPDMIHLNGRLR
jgi:hypothetical protein